MIHEAAAKGFESGSDAYERGRPSFPKEAVDRMALEIGLARPGALIVDLGAGTGKFTELLAEHPLRRADLVAVEPVRAMREKLIGKKLAGCRVVEGAAERLPFGDASVDAVTVAQAFHWFDGDRALAELARVLKPGGKLALVWNTRDERADWVRRLTELIDVHEGGAPRHRTGRWRECFARARSFTELQRVDVEHVHSGTVDTVVDRVVSISFIAALPEAERARVAAAVRELVATHPDTRERSRIDFPYVTSLYFCARIPS